MVYVSKALSGVNLDCQITFKTIVFCVATNSKFRGAELTPKHPLSSQGCRFDCACQRSARELYEARMGIGKQPSFPTRQPPSYERDRPRLENHLMPSSSKQHPREFVLDVETYDHHRETQFDDGHSDPLLRKLLLENAMLNQELADTKQCMMYYIRTMHSQIQEMNKKLLDRMLGIKQEPEETHKKRYCKWHYTITRSYEPVVVYV